MTDVYGAARPRRSARRRVATRQQQSFWRSLGIVPPPPPSGRLRAAWRLHGRRRDRGRRDGRRDRGWLAGRLIPPDPQRLHQFGVGGPLDDGVELRPVVADQADPLDQHVVRAPLVTLAREAVVHRDLRSLLGDDPRSHRGQVAVQLLADVENLFPRVDFDLGRVGIREQIPEQPGELLALGRRARLPVAGQASLRDLAEIEQLVGDGPDRRPPVGRPGVRLHQGIVQNLDHAVDPILDLVRRRTSLGGIGRQQSENHDDRRYDAPSAHQPPLAESSLSGGRFSVRVTARPSIPRRPGREPALLIQGARRDCQELWVSRSRRHASERGTTAHMAYDHLEIEARWQRYWDEHGTFRAARRSGRPKRYVLTMLPYPSGGGR